MSEERPGDEGAVPAKRNQSGFFAARRAPRRSAYGVESHAASNKIKEVVLVEASKKKLLPREDVEVLSMTGSLPSVITLLTTTGRSAASAPDPAVSSLTVLMAVTTGMPAASVAVLEALKYRHVCFQVEGKVLAVNDGQATKKKSKKRKPFLFPNGKDVQSSRTL